MPKPSNFLRGPSSGVTLREARLHGFAAAEQAQAPYLDPEKLSAARAQVAAAVETFKGQIADLEATVKTALLSIGQSAGVSALDNVRQLAKSAVATASELASFGTIEGRAATATEYGRVVNLLAKVASNYAEVVSNYNARFGNQVASDVLARTAAWTAELSAGLAQLATDLVAFLQSVGGTLRNTGKAAETISWLLPLGILGLFVLPTLLKGASAARSGGDPYAAIGEDISAGRASFNRGVASVGRYAAARAGA